MIEGEELDLMIGTVSMLSLIALSLAARSTADGTISKDELPTACPTGVYGCARLTGEAAGTNDPSEMGISAGSWLRVRGTSRTRDLPLSCLLISAKLVLLLSLLLILGLVAGPEVSALDQACTCPATRFSPKGRRTLWFADSTIASWVWGPAMPVWRPLRDRRYDKV